MNCHKNKLIKKLNLNKMLIWIKQCGLFSETKGLVTIY